MPQKYDLAEEIGHLRHYLGEEDTDTINEAGVSKHAELRALLKEIVLVKNANGMRTTAVPRLWYEQFNFTQFGYTPTMEDIGRVINPDDRLFTLTAYSSLNTYLKEHHPRKVYTATIDYFATGEGVTRRFLAFIANGKALAMCTAAEYLSGYFAVGMDLHEGLPPETDTAAQLLLSDNMRRYLEKEILNPMNVHIDLELHANYS